MPEKIRERWNSFVSGKLTDVNKQNMSELVSVVIYHCRAIECLLIETLLALNEILHNELCKWTEERNVLGGRSL